MPAGRWPVAATVAAARPLRSGGFTLLELMVVMAIFALTAGLVWLAVPDPQARRLEQEAARLVMLLEGARAEARAYGLEVQWAPQGPERPEPGVDFRFDGLPAALAFPTSWIDRGTTAEVIGARAVRLGPEPLVGAQRIALKLGAQTVVVATDGLSPFAVDTPPGKP